VRWPADEFVKIRQLVGSHLQRRESGQPKRYTEQQWSKPALPKVERRQPGSKDKQQRVYRQEVAEPDIDLALGQRRKNDERRADQEEERVPIDWHAGARADECGPNEHETAQRCLDEKGQGEIVPPPFIRIPAEQERGLA
jgi:hypothetical protein